MDPPEAKKSATSASMRNMAFERLPDEIIEQILQLTNPNGFASLIVLNRKWRMVSQQTHLYAHHLSRCPSYSAAHRPHPLPDDEDSLPHLRALFGQEIKRNLFEAYLRPRETVISLVSTSISSSSAPGGEAFHFSLSPRGHYVLAYNSSRIHVIDVTGPAVEVKRELKILRRPASTTITDDGSLLAVLSTDLQIDLYDLKGDHPKRTRSIALDHTPRTIALSPTGAVLAAAYDSGVEVSSLDPECMSTERRAVKCYGVDSLSFSRDGTQLLGTTMQSRNPSTVVLTAPYYDPGASLPEDSVSALWTTSILFPNGSRDCSHAVLLPSACDGEAGWTFTYDRVFETFRAVRIDDLRNGTTYFTGPVADSASISTLLPSTLPAASKCGDLVASGFQGAIWLYGVPEDLEAMPTSGNGISSNSESEVSTPLSQLGRRNSAPSLRSINRPRESSIRTPQWQLLCDRFRNTFVEGRKMTTLDRVSALTWVSDMSTSFHGERLVAVAPGIGGQPPISEDDGMSPVDGGRISILDFDYATTDGKKKIITIEVGNKEPEVLEEEHRDLDTEVAIVRRRTVAQRRSQHNHVARSSTIAGRNTHSDPPPVPRIEDALGGRFTAPTSPPRRISQQIATADQAETASVDEEQEAFDDPYSHTSPRSGTTLRRAATAAAVNRRLHPRTVAQEHIEYRRADGREEHPHESDADNWVPPPPPYTKDPIPPLPEHIQRSILAEAAVSTLQRANTQRSPSLDFLNMDTSSLSRSRTVASTSTGGSRRDTYPFQRNLSDSTTMNSDRVSFDDDHPRPVTSPVSAEFDDLYDVSPPGTPQPAQRRTVNQIPRRPVGAPANNFPESPASPPLVMQATLQQPISPVPQPPISPTPQQTVHRTESIDRRLQDWEGTVESPMAVDAVTSMSSTSSSSPNIAGTMPSLGIAPSLKDKDVPPRPTQDHHLTELPPETPILSLRRHFLESLPPAPMLVPSNLQEARDLQPSPLPRRVVTAPVTRSPNEMENEPIPIWRRSGSEPVNPTSVTSVHQTSNSLGGPSADQLARLNSRSGRPPNRVLTDPRRRSISGSPHQQIRSVSGNSRHRHTTSWESMQRNSQISNNTPPRVAVGALGPPSSQHNNSQPPQHGPYSTPPSRRISLGNSRMSTSSPSLRPPMARLETIHSITSTGNGEPSPYFAQKAINAATIARVGSRAERSAAKNIKDAKKRGWRASMHKEKKSKEKYGDTASSAGWTDVSRDEGRGYERERQKKTGGKCVVM